MPARSYLHPDLIGHVLVAWMASWFIQFFVLMPWGGQAVVLFLVGVFLMGMPMQLLYLGLYLHRQHQAQPVTYLTVLKLVVVAAALLAIPMMAGLIWTHHLPADGSSVLKGLAIWMTLAVGLGWFFALQIHFFYRLMQVTRVPAPHPEPPAVATTSHSVG